MLKICIIGGSGHYRYVVKSLDTDMRVCGIAPGSSDEDLSKLRAALAEAGLQPKEYSDWQTMLAAEQPDVAVVNCHFGDHAAINLACLRRGLHVFSEKPVATELDDLHALRAAHQAGRSSFSAMFGIRYKPAFLAAHTAVSAGRIGAVRLMQAQKSYKLGTRPSFFSERVRSGGLLPWVGSHAIDWLRWFTGASFLSVSARHSRVANKGNGELEVSAQCLFEMSDEICATLSIDYLRPASASTHDDDSLRVVGTRGVVEVRDGLALLSNDEAPGTQALPLPPARSIFADFAAQVRGQSRCMVSAEDAFVVTEASLLARQAADEKRVVTVSHWPGEPM